MNTAVSKRTEVSISAQWDWVDIGLALAGLALAVIAAIIYLGAAINFQNQPFIGALLSRDLTVRSASSFSDIERDGTDLSYWPARANDIRPGDKIIGVEAIGGDTIIFDQTDPLGDLETFLQTVDSGDTIFLIVEPEGTPPASEYWTSRPLGDDVEFLVDVTPGNMPLVDFFGHFVLGYLLGLASLAISAYVFLRRPQLRASKYFLFTGSLLSIVLMGSFDYVSSHEYVSLWILSACLTAGSLVTLSLEFPAPISLIERLPVLRYVPVLIGVALSYFFYTLYQDNVATAIVWPIFLIGIGAMALIGITLYRRQYTFSPILREQASYVVIGAIAAFGPMAIVSVGQLLTSPDIGTGIRQAVQVTTILFVISTAYALSQDRLLETDILLPNLFVYGLLALLLFGSYIAIVMGLSLIGARSINSNSPVIVGALVAMLAVFFVPLQNTLRSRIDRLMFRQRREYQERLEDFMNRLTNAINVNDVEKALHNQLNDTVAPNEEILFVRDTESQVFRARPNLDLEKPVTDVTFTLDSGLAQYLENEASILYIQEGKALPPLAYKDKGRLAVLNMPVWVRLKGQRQLNGFLTLDHRGDGNQYTYEELRFIERIADQVALALERAQIVDDLEQRFRVQDVLSQVSRALNFAIDLDTMMELVFAQTGRVIESDIFAVAIVDRFTNEMYYAFFAKGDERLSSLEGRRWKMGRDLVSEVARLRKPIVTEDYIVELRRYDPSAKPQFPDIKAWMAVPLTTARANETLGVMVVGSVDATVQYSDEQRNLFMDIANLASNAIDKTRLFEATQTRTQQLEALNEISSQLSYEIEDVDRLLDLITRSAIGILNVEAGSLLLLDEEEGDLVFRVALGPNAEELVGKRIDLETQSLSAESLKTAEPIIVNDTSSDSRWHGELLVEEEDMEEVPEAFHSRAILTTPLIAQGEAIGVLQIINKKDRSNFNDEDVQLLTTFAAQAAVAIQNARLFASQDQQLLQRVEELDRMAAIDQSLNQTLELTRVVEITLEWAIRQSGATAGMIAIIAPGSDAMTVVGAKNYPEESIFYGAIGSEITIDKGIWSRVIRSKTSVFTRDVATDPDYVETLSNALSQIVVPIISVSDVIGVLLVESNEEAALTLLDLQFLTRLADHASPAITNSQLFEQLNLQQSQRAEFVSFIAHELKAPMTSMKGYTDLLMRGVVGEINDQQKDFLNTIYSNVNRMDALVSDLRDIETYEAGKMRLEMAEVDFRSVVEESYAALQQQFEAKEQKVELQLIDKLPTVWGDDRRLVQVVTNFLTNANKYTPEGGVIRIRAETAVNVWDTEGVRRVIHVEVEDDGIGISDEDQKKLFREKYFRTDNPKALDQPGTGLGMVLTRGLILQHGGTVWVESVIEEGTTFHFTVPIAEEALRRAM